MKGKMPALMVISLIALVLFILIIGCLEGTQEKNIVLQMSDNSSDSEPFEIYTEEQPPFNYINSQGLISGRSTEVVREIMKRQGIIYPIHMVPWADGYRAVLTNENTLIYSIIMTHEREPKFRWVGPIAELQYSFFTRSDNPVQIHSINDLRTGGNIAVVSNDARESYLQSLQMKNILSLKDDAACIQALSSGDAEFWLGTKDIYTQNAKRVIWEHSAEIRRVELPILSQRLYIGFNRKVPVSVVYAWQQVLDEIKADGTYDLIQNRYMPYICSWVRCTS